MSSAPSITWLLVIIRYWLSSSLPRATITPLPAPETMYCMPHCVVTASVLISTTVSATSLTTSAVELYTVESVETYETTGCSSAGSCSSAQAAKANVPAATATQASRDIAVFKDFFMD